MVSYLKYQISGVVGTPLSAQEHRRLDLLLGFYHLRIQNIQKQSNPRHFVRRGGRVVGGLKFKIPTHSPHVFRVDVGRLRAHALDSHIFREIGFGQLQL